MNLDTRSTLINRLKDWRDDTSWEIFFNKYWHLIYAVAKRAGLSEHEARDVVQETVISVAQRMPEFTYDARKGSFKAWLLRIARRRIADQFEKRPKGERRPTQDSMGHGKTSFLSRLPDPAASDLESIWDREWQKHLIDRALEKVKQQVKPSQYEIFETYVLQELKPREVAKRLKVSLSQVYVVKFRMSQLLEKELRRVEKELA